jgi:dolichol-phosphate mannosyltransferase
VGILAALRAAPSWVRWLLAMIPLRIAMIPLIPILPEEAYHWNFARHLDWGYYDHPPIIAWSIAAGRLLFGDTAFGVRSVTLLYAVGTSILLARMAKRFYGEAAAVWAVILFTFMPVALPVSAAGFPDSPLLFFWALTMTLVWNAIDGTDGRRWLAAGAALGLAMMSKYTAIMLVPAVFLYLVMSKEHRRWLASPWPYLAGVVALVVFTPVIYWNWKHEWASFLYQSQGRFEEARGTSGRPFSFLLFQLLAGFALTFPLLGAAAVRVFRTARPEERFLGLCMVPIFLAFWIVSFRRPAHVLWPLPGYLGVLVVMSGVAADGTGAIARIYGRTRFGLVSLSLLVMLAVGIHLAWFLPWLSPFQGPYGWKEVAERAREVRSTMPESAFYMGLGRKYTCTSQLAWQLNLPYEVHGDNLVGAKALQYTYWADPAALKGRDAVVVIESPSRARQYEPIVRRCFDSLERVGEVVVPVGRSPIKPEDPLTFVLYRARGYRPPATK